MRVQSPESVLQPSREVISSVRSDYCTSCSNVTTAPTSTGSKGEANAGSWTSLRSKRKGTSGRTSSSYPANTCATCPTGKASRRGTAHHRPDLLERIEASSGSVHLPLQEDHSVFPVLVPYLPSDRPKGVQQPTDIAGAEGAPIHQDNTPVVLPRFGQLLDEDRDRPAVVGDEHATVGVRRCEKNGIRRVAMVAIHPILKRHGIDIVSPQLLRQDWCQVSIK